MQHIVSHATLYILVQTQRFAGNPGASSAAYIVDADFGDRRVHMAAGQPERFPKTLHPLQTPFDPSVSTP